MLTLLHDDCFHFRSKISEVSQRRQPRTPWRSGEKGPPPPVPRLHLYRLPSCHRCWHPVGLSPIFYLRQEFFLGTAVKIDCHQSTYAVICYFFSLIVPLTWFHLILCNTAPFLARQLSFHLQNIETVHVRNSFLASRRPTSCMRQAAKSTCY